jgi:hypothetical protein
MKTRQTRSTTRSASPRTSVSGQRAQHGPTSQEYMTKEEASVYLGDLSLRRIDELIKQQHWTTRKEKREGWRVPNRVIRYEDVRTYKASQSAPTIDVGEPQKALVKPEKGRELRATPQVLDALVKILERMAPPSVVTPERYLTLEEASAYIGLPRTYLVTLCRLKRLPFLLTGSGKERQRMVRVLDLQRIGNNVVARGAA